MTDPRASKDQFFHPSLPRALRRAGEQADIEAANALEAQQREIERLHRELEHMADMQLAAAVNRPAPEPATGPVAPIACIRVGEDDTCEVVHLYAPGLPPGEHDLFPVPLNPNGQLAPSMFSEALCPHGMRLAENICGPCSQGRPNRAAQPQAPTHCNCGAQEWPPNTVQIEDSRGRLHTLRGCQPGATSTKEPAQ